MRRSCDAQRDTLRGACALWVRSRLCIPVGISSQCGLRLPVRSDGDETNTYYNKCTNTLPVCRTPRPRAARRTRDASQTRLRVRPLTDHGDGRVTYILCALSRRESAESRLSRRPRDMSCSPHTNKHPASGHKPGKMRIHSGLQPAQRVQGGAALGDRGQQQLAQFGLVGLPIERREHSVLSA